MNAAYFQGRLGGAAAAAGYPGAAGGPPGAAAAPGFQAGGAPALGAAGGFGAPGANTTEPDYSDPVHAAETFLSAVQNKDARILAEAVAIRGQFEAATEERKKMFEALKNENLAQEEMDELARQFDGMKVMNKNLPKSSGNVRVVVGKQEDNRLYTRTLIVRREKDGWKIQDFTKQRMERTGLSTKSKERGGYGR